jgi:hypothetical protein
VAPVMGGERRHGHGAKGIGDVERELDQLRNLMKISEVLR